VEAALARYEARMRPVVERTQATGRRNARWVVPASRWRIVARDMILRLSRLPGMARLLAPIISSGGEEVFSESE
jgi:2-polyprenyl-6-methoxyphenol hydroxylase-like FAD-dependent oxidoreductase